ncbi:MAG: TonB-dependent receptor, partial [Bryobacterales bacterium]|nr:TonB-dependent receptor [Bryobacterales bacterium]
MSRYLRTLGLLLLSSLISTTAAFAQATSGTITGSVTDPTGAAIPAVKVTVTETATGLVRTSTSDESGNFRFLLLPVGNYRIDAAAEGFKAFRREGVIIEADRSLGVPIRLEVGSLVDVVEVVGGTPLLEPNTSALGTVMDRQKVEDLPLNGRNPMGLANLVPTVRGIGYFGGQVLSSWRMAAVSIGGGSPLHNDFMVDGIGATKLSSAGAQIYPTVESTQEFKILTNAMSAEFGRTGGGIVSVITKSGTNNFHGNLFHYVRNDNFNANEFFSNRNGGKRPSLAWNQFGGSLGGPVIKNRLFFFTNYEGFTERRITQSITNSATLRQRAGDFSDTRVASGALITIYDPATTTAAGSGFTRAAFPGNIIPASRISDISRKIMTYWPEPNLPGLPNTQAQNLFLQGAGPIDRNTFTAKMDYNISSARRISGRYTWDDLDWRFPRVVGTAAEVDGRDVYIPRHSASLNYTDSLRPTLLFEGKLGFARENENYVMPSDGFDITTLGFPASFARLGSQDRGARFPTVGISDMATMANTSTSGNPSLSTLASGTMTKLTGRHTIKFGGEHRFYGINRWGRSNSVGNFSFGRGFTQGPNPLQASANAGYGVATFMLGTPTSGLATRSPNFTQGLNHFAGFLQEDWRVSNNLTLNLGVRWEYEGPLTDRYNLLTNFDRTVASPLRVPGMNLQGGLTFPGVGGRGRGLTERVFNNWAPRIGYAYKFGQKMVFRGGYGLMYIPSSPFIGPTTTGFSLNTPMVSSIDGGLTPYHTLADPFPQGLLDPLGVSLGAATGLGQSVAGQLFNVRRGYAQQGNFTVQYEPWNNWLLEAAWVVNKGTRLQGAATQLNNLTDAQRALGTTLAQSVPNPFFGLIDSGPLAAATVTRQQLLLPYPQFTGVNGGFTYNHNSIYHALAVKIEKRFSKGLSMLVAYTASKNIDDGNASGQIRPGGNTIGGVQDWFNLRAERSKSAEDIPQRLVWTTLWNLPVATQATGLKRAIIGGWQLNPILTMESGPPVAMSASVVGGGNRPNVVAGQQPKIE